MLNRSKFKIYKALSLVIDVFVLFIPADLAAHSLTDHPCLELSRSSWMRVFKDLFKNLPFVHQADRVSLVPPFNQMTSVSTVAHKLVDIEGSSDGVSTRQGILLRYRTEHRDPASYKAFMENGVLQLDAKQINTIIKGNHVKLPYEGRLELVCISSMFKAVNVKKETVSATSIQV